MRVSAARRFSARAHSLDSIVSPWSTVSGDRTEMPSASRKRKACSGPSEAAAAAPGSGSASEAQRLRETTQGMASKLEEAEAAWLRAEDCARILHKCPKCPGTDALQKELQDWRANGWMWIQQQKSKRACLEVPGAWPDVDAAAERFHVEARKMLSTLEELERACHATMQTELTSGSD